MQCIRMNVLTQGGPVIRLADETALPEVSHFSNTAAICQ